MLVRASLPPSLKDSAIHERTTSDRETARPIHYAGSGACGDCHAEAEAKKKGYHRNLSCETCHGPAQAHIDSSEVKPNLPKLREFCVRCHAYDPSRPTGFPQINPSLHNPLKACISCHNPHDPKPPTVPHACSACHGEIARTKAVSAHEGLECTTCHVVPREHGITPRASVATIPTDRAFCGKCHAKEAANLEAAKVDMVAHGEKYLCWQCHYPHMPEVK